MPEKTFSNILLLAEGTDEGMQAARMAIELAAHDDATLIVVSVADTSKLRQLLTYRIFIQQEMDEFQKEIEASCQKQLDYVIDLARKKNVKTRASLQKGAIHAVVLQEQKAQNADLVVMGAFRTSRAKTDVMAREKELVVEEIACPVLLVPAPPHARL
jgi:nucleotide-binding universal stress UspA family protein